MAEQYDKDLRKLWRTRWLSMLYTFSHIEYLKKILKADLLPNSRQWGELTCQYFDDLYLDEDYRDSLQDGTISRAELEAIAPFHFSFRKYSAEADIRKPGWPDRRTLVDEEWLAVVDTGRKCWHALKNIITDPEELKFIELLEKE